MSSPEPLADSPLPEAGNDPLDGNDSNHDFRDSPTPPIADPTRDMEQPDLSDNDSVLSDIDEAQFEDFDPANIAIEDRPAIAVDEDNVGLIGRHKRSREEGTEIKKKKKEGRREKPKKRKRQEEDDDFSGGQEIDGKRSSRRRKAEGGGGERRRVQRATTPEEELDPETRMSINARCTRNHVLTYLRPTSRSRSGHGRSAQESQPQQAPAPRWRNCEYPTISLPAPGAHTF